MISVFLAGWLLCIGNAAEDSKADVGHGPNMVFFYIDDFGWTDLGWMGSDYYETPHIDQLAADSVVFTQAYSNGPNCAPSRASLMTGLYTPAHGIYTVGDPVRGNHAHRRWEPVANKTVLDATFVTIAERLKEAGYTTASMGKWHLGDDPRTQGFDVNRAGREWGSPSGGGYHSPYQYPELVQETRGEYLTDRLTDEAINFISDHRETPFFLYLAHYAVHTPIQAKAALQAKYERKPKGIHHQHAAYAAMIESVDESVGRVLDYLEALDLTKRTVVVFSSDNGGLTHPRITSNAPLRGGKGMLYEGGIRVPLTIRWPGVTGAGGRCAEPVLGMDLHPTLVEIAVGPSVRSDVHGTSLVPLLRAPEGSLGRPGIFWHFPCYLQGKGDPHGGPFRTTPAGAIRAGDWKLIEFFETGRLELYNLKADIGESDNLVDQFPDKARQLLALMEKWRQELHAPVPTVRNPRYRGSL